MEYIDYSRRNRRKIEKIVLVVLSIYMMVMFILAVKNKTESWICATIMFAMILSWMVCIGKYKDYKFRAIFIAIMVQLGLCSYATCADSVATISSTFIAVVIILGLYEIAEVIYVPIVSFTILIIYYMFDNAWIGLGIERQQLVELSHIGSVYMIEYVVSIMLKKHTESNEQLLKMIDELKEVQQSKDDFMANVSHEIRTPINTICGMSDVILRGSLDQDVRDGVFSIQTAGQNLMSIVSDILDFSELQSGKMEIVEVPYNITSTINDIINMSMARKSEKNIELIVDCDANMPVGLLGDELKIRRVIMNLVNNAIKFTNDGCVCIIISHRKEDYGINLSVTVKDTGIGMKQESLEKLFTSFNQVDTKRNRQEGGIGLGLAISHAIVKKMGGFIMVKSQLGKGSEVQFVIPQKVTDESPIAVLNDKDKINAATYINMEQFDMMAIRDEYTSMMSNIISQLAVKCRVCHNLVELKRREMEEHFTHVFISLVEYQENTEYFSELAKRTNLIVIYDRPYEKYIVNQNFQRICKPFFVLPVVMILNGKKEVDINKPILRSNRFTAPGIHVLVVDDNIMNIKVVEGLLKNYKIMVTMATSGAEALEKIESMKYDFVFMDHMMPEMDGIETLQRIRKKNGRYFQEIPIIVLTANAIAGSREMFLEAGFDDFVAKPVELSVLERVLKAVIPQNKIVMVDEEVEDNKEKIWSGQKNSSQPVQIESGSYAGELNSSIQIDLTKPEHMEYCAHPLQIGDLNFNKGIMFCGNEEMYRELLILHAETGDENRDKLKQSYEQKDWKNYVIQVHGIKSSMLSIGAIKLSEMAKQLEMAGKKEDYDYIEANHGDMIIEYNRVLQMLQNSPVLNEGPTENIDQSNMELDMDLHMELDFLAEMEKSKNDSGIKKEHFIELEEEEFENKLVTFENALYMLDVDIMREIVAELKGYSYHGTPLKQELVTIERKIEMSDYMSAFEQLENIQKG